MAIVIKRWRSKPTYIQEVTVTEENFREVASWLGAESVGIEYQKDQTFVRFGGLPEDMQNFGSLSVLIGESVYKQADGSVRVQPKDEIKKKYRKV